MANESHRKILVAEAAVDFDASFAEIDSLPAGDLCWAAPLTGLGDCDYADFQAKIKTGASTPAGTVEFWVGRGGTNLKAAEAFATLTDHGTEGTAATVANMLACLHQVANVSPDETADKVYTLSFRVWYPGNYLQLYCYNNTDEALNGTSSPHAVYVTGWGPELQ